MNEKPILIIAEKNEIIIIQLNKLNKMFYLRDLRTESCTDVLPGLGLHSQSAVPVLPAQNIKRELFLDVTQLNYSTPLFFLSVELNAKISQINFICLK